MESQGINCLGFPLEDQLAQGIINKLNNILNTYSRHTLTTTYMSSIQ